MCGLGRRKKKELSSYRKVFRLFFLFRGRKGMRKQQSWFGENVLSTAEKIAPLFSPYIRQKYLCRICCTPFIFWPDVGKGDWSANGTHVHTPRFPPFSSPPKIGILFRPRSHSGKQCCLIRPQFSFVVGDDALPGIPPSSLQKSANFGPPKS